MSICTDVCVVCSKIVKNCHKYISCQICKGYVHKKCTKLRPKQLKCLNPKEWVCSKFPSNNTVSDSDIEEDIDNLNESPQFNPIEVDLKKYDKMVFNPLRFESHSTIFDKISCKKI